MGRGQQLLTLCYVGRILRRPLLTNLMFLCSLVTINTSPAVTPFHFTLTEKEKRDREGEEREAEGVCWLHSDCGVRERREGWEVDAERELKEGAETR